MGNISRNEKAKQVKRAAGMFVVSRDAKRIAKQLGVSDRTVYRLIERDDFHAALDALGYDGPRHFRTQIARQPALEREVGRQLWDTMQHIPRRQRGRAIAEEMGIPVRCVWNWMRDW